MIRWASTNSTILHLDSSSRRHEMSVDSFPFIRLVPFLSFYEQRQMERVIQSDQTPETPGTKGGKRSHETGGSMETTEQSKMCR